MLLRESLREYGIELRQGRWRILWEGGGVTGAVTPYKCPESIIPREKRLGLFHIPPKRNFNQLSV